MSWKRAQEQRKVERREEYRYSPRSKFNRNGAHRADRRIEIIDEIGITEIKTFNTEEEK